MNVYVWVALGVVSCDDTAKIGMHKKGIRVSTHIIYNSTSRNIADPFQILFFSFF